MKQMNQNELVGQPVKSYAGGRGRMSATLLALLLLTCAPAIRAASLVHEFFLPMPEAQIRQTFVSLETNVSSVVESIFSVVITGQGTVIYYDQWEDGYEIDLANPVQPSTRVWGDGNNLNGIPPGFANDPVGLPAGTVLSLRNQVPLPRNPANLFYDGRDRVAATKALVVSRTAWPTTPGSVLAGAVEVTATIDYGTNYISPVGQDMTNKLFQYCGVMVMAAVDNTSVTIDTDGGGVTAPFTILLNRGESHLVNGGIKKGASIVSTKPVQADLVIGHFGARYASDWFALYPVEQWSDSYYTPVGTAANNNQTFAYLFNPNSSNITVNVTTRIGSATLNVPANGGVVQYQMPKSSGAKFTSANGAKFFALSTVGANPSADNAYDWGFSFLPADGLTTEAVVGWGPGSTDGSVNGSPVWVTPVGATRVYVDYDGDRAGPLTDPNGINYDVHYDMVALESRTIYDPDRDQTAMRLYTLDGTPISAAWGEDPAVASAGNPYIDAGTTVLPFPVPLLQKFSVITNDVNPPGLSVGDTLLYTVTLDNHGLLPLGNTVLLDAPSGLVVYSNNTTTVDGNLIADSVSGTPFPLDASGYIIPVILRGGTSTVSYQMNVVAAGVISNYVTAVGYGISAVNDIQPPPVTGSTFCALDFTDSGVTPLATYTAGATVYVRLTDGDKNTVTNTVQSISVTVSNATSGDYEIITLAETGVNTGIFRNAGGLVSSTSSGVGQNDGTLNVVAGDVLTVRYIDPVFLDTCSATASVIAPPQTKVLYLSDLQTLDRVNPVAAGDVTTSQSIELGGGVAATIGVDNTSAAGTTSATLTLPHTTGAGANRLMLVSVAFDKGGGDVTNVTYNGISLTNVAGVDNTSGPIKPRADIWQLVNPPTGTFNVVVSFSTGTGIDGNVGVVTFTNVNQSTPVGAGATATGNSAAASVNVTAAAGDLVFDTVSVANNGAATAGAGQTTRWTTNTGSIRGAGSTEAGAASVTMSWANGNARWAIVGVPIKPATSGGTNVTSFVQTPVFCQDFVMPAGGPVSITNFVTVTSGVMPANPNITARLHYGSTIVATLSNPTYTAGNSNLVWTGTLGSGVTVPSGQALELVVSNAQAGVSFVLDFDSAAKPAKISLPTSTVIDVTSVGVYDAPYPGGSLVNTPVAGSTLYVRTVVSDPFGSYDISSLGLAIDGPGVVGDINTTSSAIVADDNCTRVYEYVWQTGSTVGLYDIAATANEGSEGITDSAATSVELTFLDLGTPSTTEFTSGNNGPATNAFPADASVCVRVTDQDQNLNPSVAESLTALVTSSTGDSESVTLTETGTNSGIFTACVAASTSGGAGTNSGTLNAPSGSVLTVVYTDPVDSLDQSSATATVLTPPGVPGVTMNKTLVSPADGQAGIGEAAIYNLQVVNSGSTTLTNVSVTDTFPAANLSFQSASLAPSATNVNSLVWANLGNFAPGASTNITVSFTATAATASAVNFATVDGGTVTNTSSVGVSITHASLTITKTVLTPTNALVNIGSNVTFRIVVLNSGDTAIPTLPLEDSFSAGCYQFVSATVPPDGAGAGSLLWNDITGGGSLAPSNSVTIDVTLLVTGGCDPANNTAFADFAVDSNGDPVPPATSTAGVTTGAGRITGFVYNDADQSGTLTVGDTGLAGVTVEAYSDPNADGDPSDGTLLRLVSTDLSGAYELLNLSTGAFVVVETDLPGYASVAPLNNRLAVVLTGLTTNANNNFFDYLIPPISYASIAGTVWADTNANGVVDGGDFGLANVSVDLVQDVNTNGFADLGETVAASTITDTNGGYLFVGVVPGNYVVQETDLYGWISTADSRPPSDNQIALFVGSGANTNGNDFLDFFTGNNPGNDAPVANNDTYSTLEDAPLNIAAPGVLGNDTDVDGDTLTAVVVSLPLNGTLTLSTNGGFTYTPNTNYNGSDSFTYRANDGTTNSGIATVNITITPVNDAPLANDDVASTPKNVAVSVPVLVNDSDPDGDALTIVAVNPSSGSAVINGTNVFFTPATNFVGTATVVYTITDGNGGTNSATITVTVSNSGPLANNDTYLTLEDTALIVPVSGVLTNDADSDGDLLVALLVSTTTQGTLSFNANGSFTYTPNTNYNGSDSFTYRVTDGISTSAVATASITIFAVNDGPIANDDFTNTLEDVSVTVNVLVNDSDAEGTPLTITGTLTTNGTAIVSGTNVVFTPDTNFNGTVVFSYTVSDGTNSASANVTVTVGAVNDTPVTVNDSYNTLKNVALNIAGPGVLGNDTDVENDTLSALLVNNPTNGTVTLNANGSFLYTPVSNYVGADVFTYRAYDSGATGNIATVTINVGATNTAPVANDDTFTTLEDTTFNIPATGVLTNDVDVDGDALSALLVANVTQGTLTLNANGSFSYTPNTNFNGSDSFTYRAVDGQSTGNVATVTINITPVNDTPIAINDVTNTVEDVSVTIAVLANDSDPEGTPLTITGTLTTNGTAIVSGTNVVFTPDTNFNGIVVLSYTVSDGTNSTSANVTVTVGAVNDTPVTVNDAYNTLKNVALNIATPGVLGNDTDVENDTLSALLVNNPTNGTLTLNANGSFLYTPVSNYVGSDVFTYRAYDTGATGNVATVTINIGATNTAPVANNDTFTTLEDTTLTIPAAGVLTNDLDIDGDALSALLVANVTQGTLTLNPNGSFSYTPNTNYNGSDSFTYRAVDGQATGNVATVTITITAVNDTPVTVNDAYNTLKNVALNIAAPGVLGNDADVENDTLSALLVNNPTNGTLTLNANGSFLYMPVSNYVGGDVFTYRAYDAGDTGNLATVTINIGATNTAPLANNDTFTTLEDTTLTIPAAGVLTNDLDIDGDALNALLVANVTQGTLTLNPNGSFTYTPNTNYNGSDSFTYRAVDGQATGNVATVTINVTPVNDTPIANNDVTNTLEDVSVTIAVLANDSDPEGTPLSITGTLTTNGTAIVSGTNVVFTPDTNFNGTVVFSYTVSDGTNSASANVTVTVGAVNDTPVTVNDAYNTLKNVALNIAAPGVLGNDTDVENDTLSALLVNNPTNGTVTLNANGSFLYTPVSNYVGSDVFTYRAYDAGATGNVATVTINVGATNTAPVANNDTFTTLEDTTLNIPAAGVLTNDLDIDGDALSALLVLNVTQGNLTLNANGSFTYTPNTNYNGSDSFAYRAVDGQATGNVAIVTINVTPVNDVPIANNDVTNTLEDVSVTVNVLVNDSDAEGTPLSITGTLTTNGTATVSGTNVVFTPSTNFNGTVVFSYTVSDGTNSASANVTVTVDAVNDTPVTVNDSYNTLKNVALSIAAPGVLGNDTDVENDTLSALLVNNPTNGTLTLNANGSFLYTPVSNYVGADVFTYRAYDTGATGNIATVTINVGATNTAPVANNDTFTTLEDTTLNIPAAGVLTNDVDIDGDALSGLLVANVTQGTLTFNANGSFSYTPNTNYNGTDSFTYRAVDGQATGNVATVTINVTPVNDTPIANNDVTNTVEDVSVTVRVLVNDSDPEGTPLSITGTLTTNGTAIVSGTNVVFTPSTNFNGTVVFSYTVSDGTNSASANVTVTVGAANDTPVTVNDSYNTLKNIALNITAPGVLANDADVETNSLSALLVNNPTNGTLTLNANGSFLYTPVSNYVGNDVFTYRAYDAGATGNIATVTISIGATNIAPVANNDTFTTLEDTTLTIPVAGVLTNDLDVDGDALSALLVANVTQGTLTLNANGSFTYTPNTNYNGSDSFTYRAVDGQATGNVATVTINITPVNDAPVTVNDSYNTLKNIAVNIAAPGVLANDTDVETNSLSALLVNNPTNGTLTLNANGSFLYTPVSNYVGSDVFTYRAYDVGATGNIATVTISIGATNIAPVANNDTFTTLEDTTLTIPAAGVLTNDLDVDGDALTALLVANVTQGTLTLNPNGSFTYTPNTNYNGTDSFTYRARDGQATGNVATVTITITPVNDAPITVNDAYNTLKNIALNITAPGVLGNDTDAETNSLSALLVSSPTNGTLTLNANGSFLYTPVSNYVGADAFTYRAYEASATGNVATVTLTVLATNTPPTANPQNVTTTQNTPRAITLTGVDPDGDPLTFNIATSPANGTLSGLNTNTGAITYTPNPTFVGTDSFTFRANDGSVDSAPATITIDVGAQSDIAVFKTGSTSGGAGTNVSFTITVTNLGPSTASNVMVFDQLPASYTFVSALPGTATVTNNLVSWPAFNLAANASSSFSVTATPNIGGVFTNIAYATNSTPDPDPTNNNGTSTNSRVVTFVQPLADVAVFKTGPGSVTSGAPITYTITITNLGPSAATNAIASDILPAGATFQSASGSFILNSGVVTWSPITLPNGGSATYTVTVTAPLTGSLTNVATGSSITADPDPTNNNGTSGTSRTTTSITPIADVAVFKSGPSTVTPGEMFAYVISVTNLGPVAAANVVVQDLLPTNLVFVSATGGGVLASNVVTWPTIASLANGAATNFTLTVTAPASGGFTNIALAVSVTSDANPTNNNGTATGSRVTSAVVPGQFGVFKANPVLNPQTGLFEERVTVTNTGASTIAAFRVLVGNINGTNGVPRTNVSLVNATGTNVDSRPYVQYNAPLNPGSNVTLILEFFVPDRRPFTNSVEVVAVLPSSTGTNGGAGVLIDRVFTDSRFTPARVVLEWTSIPGRSYTVIYSDVSPAGPWMVATPTVTAPNNRVQWYDDGQPKTMSPPMSVTSRFYRVILNP